MVSDLRSEISNGSANVSVSVKREELVERR